MADVNKDDVINLSTLIGLVLVVLMQLLKVLKQKKLEQF